MPNPFCLPQEQTTNRHPSPQFYTIKLKSLHQKLYQLI